MEERVFPYKGMDVYYYTDGDASKTPLVLLHAAFADHHLFMKQVEYFKDSYYIVAFDMVGHGKSRIGGSSAGIVDMPEIVKGVLDDLNLGKAHLMGVSMGSLVAQSFAYANPDRVLSLTIVGGYSIHRDFEGVLKEQNKEMLKWVFYIVFSMKRFRRYILKMSVESEDGKNLFQMGLDVFTRSSFKGMQGLNRIFVERDEPLKYPLLIVCGVHDNDVVRHASKKLELSEPGSRFVEVPEAGHCANADNSAHFNEIVEPFLAGGGYVLG